MSVKTLKALASAVLAALTNLENAENAFAEAVAEYINALYGETPTTINMLRHIAGPKASAQTHRKLYNKCNYALQRARQVTVAKKAASPARWNAKKWAAGLKKLSKSQLTRMSKLIAGELALR